MENLHRMLGYIFFNQVNNLRLKSNTMSKRTNTLDDFNSRLDLAGGAMNPKREEFIYRHTSEMLWVLFQTTTIK